MHALKHLTPIYSIIFVESRYWPDIDEGQRVISTINEVINEYLYKDSTKLILKNIVISSESELEAFIRNQPEGFGFFIPISGAVQPWILRAAEYFSAIGIWAGYVPEFLDEKVAHRLLEANAAPAIADVYSVIKRKGITVVLSGDIVELMNLWKAVQTVERMKKSSLLLVGTTENWVISSCRSIDRIHEKIGIECRNVALQELYKIYNSVSDKDTQITAEKWLQNCREVVEPKRRDVLAASRLVLAIEQLISQYDADGIAIACFTLLGELNTTSCLALSALNDSPYYIGACEGDMDSALTLLMMKALTDTPSWMANPIIEKDGVLKLSHCTAPLCMKSRTQPYRLRNHHESKIGVSPEVALPEGMPVTIARIGNDLNYLSVSAGTTIDTIYTPTCRTQLRIKLDSMPHFIENLLGCHQIVTYGEHLEALSDVGKLLELKVLK